MNRILPSPRIGRRRVGAGLVDVQVILELWECFTKHGGTTEDSTKGVRHAWDKQSMNGATSQAKSPIRQAAPKATR